MKKTVIDEAKINFIRNNNLTFLQSDALEFTCRDKFNWIFAFNSLHWISEQQQITLLTKIKDMLTDDGKVLLTLGLRHEPLWTIIDHIIQHKKWKKYFIDYQNPRAFFTQDSYERILNRSGIALPQTNIKHVKHFFLSQIQFEKFVVAWLPHMAQLPSSQHNEFMRDISNEYLKTSSLDDAGRVAVNFQNLEVILKNHPRILG